VTLSVDSGVVFSVGHAQVRDQVAASKWASATIERIVVYGISANEIAGITLRHGTTVQRIEYGRAHMPLLVFLILY
jgi:hypothetical protein